MSYPHLVRNCGENDIKEKKSVNTPAQLLIELREVL